MDGVLIDTEKLYLKYWKISGKEAGYDIKDQYVLGIRSLPAVLAREKMKSYLGQEFDYDGIKQKRRQMMEEHIKENGVERKAGAVELLTYLKEEGYVIGVATATELIRAKGYLEQIEILPFFDAVISAHMVEKGKPEPDIYEYAAKQLGVEVSKCYAVEDSKNGVTAAYRAGCQTIAIKDLDEPDEETLSMCVTKVNRLDEIISYLENNKKKQESN